VRRIAALGVCALGAAVLVGCKRSGGGSSAEPPLPSGAVPVASTDHRREPLRPAPSLAPGADVPRSFADLAARADAAVVFVKTLQEQRGRSGRSRPIGEGLGSAFVYDPDGLILTNNHVIENATNIRVIFGDKRELKATILGRDPPTDVALLRVEAKGLAYLVLGDSEGVRVGDWVVAIGNPFGLSHTVSAGIVSAKGRTGSDVRGLGDSSGYYDFIQTDASINPGNSGGPLLDMSGRAVGINTAIRARANNIGFAIPINMVKELVPQLLEHGRVRRSAIGAKVVPVLDQDVARLELEDRYGALVSQVTRGGPADRAGLQVDDLIVGVNGERTPAPEKLRWLVSLAGVNKEVSLRIMRGKRLFDLKVRLAELPNQDATREEPEVAAEESDPFR
jgi:serine protease Do